MVYHYYQQQQQQKLLFLLHRLLGCMNADGRSYEFIYKMRDNDIVVFYHMIRTYRRLSAAFVRSNSSHTQTRTHTDTNRKWWRCRQMRRDNYTVVCGVVRLDSSALPDHHIHTQSYGEFLLSVPLIRWVILCVNIFHDQRPTHTSVPDSGRQQRGEWVRRLNTKWNQKSKKKNAESHTLGRIFRQRVIVSSVWPHLCLSLSVSLIRPVCVCVVQIISCISVRWFCSFDSDSYGNTFQIHLLSWIRYYRVRIRIDKKCFHIVDDSKMKMHFHGDQTIFNSLGHSLILCVHIRSHASECWMRKESVDTHNWKIPPELFDCFAKFIKTERERKRK